MNESRSEASAIASDDASYRARANALQSLGKLKAANAFVVLTAAVNADSPDDFCATPPLRSLGYLGDDKGVPLLREWAAPGAKRRDAGSSNCQPRSPGKGQ